MDSANYPIAIGIIIALLTFTYLRFKKKNIYKQIIVSVTLGLISWFISNAYLKYGDPNITSFLPSFGYKKSPSSDKNIATKNIISNETVTQMSLRQ